MRPDIQELLDASDACDLPRYEAAMASIQQHSPDVYKQIAPLLGAEPDPDSDPPGQVYDDAVWGMYNVPICPEEDRKAIIHFLEEVK